MQRLGELRLRQACVLARSGDLVDLDLRDTRSGPNSLHFKNGLKELETKGLSSRDTLQ